MVLNDKLFKEFKGSLKNYREFNGLIYETQVMDILGFKAEGKELVSIDGEARIEETLETLKRNSLFSLPVFGSPESVPFTSEKDYPKHSQDCYIGMLGTFEIISFMLGCFFTDQSVVENPYSGEKVTVKTWKNAKLKDITKNHAMLTETPIKDVVRLNPHYSERKNEMKSFVYEHDHIAMVVKQMANANMSRLPVMNKESIVVGVVSESDLIREIVGMEGRLPPIFGESINTLYRELVSEKFWKLDHDTITSTALQIMESNSQQSVAVMKSGEGLYSNFSLSDVKGITVSNIEDLNLPLYAYLQKYKKSAQQWAPITVTLHTSLLSLLKLMSQTKIHGVWVYQFENLTNKESDIIGFIPMKSVISLLNNLLSIN